MLWMISVSLWLPACAPVKEAPALSIPDRLPLTYQVYPETKGSFAFSWKDTLGEGSGYHLHDRPMELWCLVMDRQGDTLGLYKGLSTPMRFTYFYPRPGDSLIQVQFEVMGNYWSEFWQDSTQFPIWKHIADTRKKYKPLQIDMREVLYQEVEVVLE